MFSKTELDAEHFFRLSSDRAFLFVRSSAQTACGRGGISTGSIALRFSAIGTINLPKTGNLPKDWEAGQDFRSHERADGIRHGATNFPYRVTSKPVQRPI